MPSDETGNGGPLPDDRPSADPQDPQDPPSAPAASTSLIGVDQRLHPSSAVFTLTSSLRSFLMPLVLLLFFSRGSSMLLYLSLFGVIPAMIGFLLKYVSYRYRLEPDELVIREGILTKNERHIPFARIQNIDLLQNPLHRMFGVAEARLETASGGKPEAVIRVLSLDAVHEMRRCVFAERHGVAVTDVAGAAVAAEEAETGVQTLVELPLREIVIYGLISNRGMVVVAAALSFLMSQMGMWGGWDEDGMIDRVTEGVTGGVIHRFNLGFLENRAMQIALVVVAFIGVALFLMRLLSVVLAVIKLYGFTLTRRGDDLRAEYGLFTRVSKTVPVHRIQTLSTRQGLIHRWFGRVSIQIETAGGGASDEEGAGGSIERQWIAPVLPRERVTRLVREILPDVDLDNTGWEGVEHRAWVRRVKGAMFPFLLVGTLLSLFVHWALGLVVLPGVVWALWWSRRSVEAEGWALTPHAVYYKSGYVGRSLSVIRFAKIQALARLESPFDRRHRMARVQVDTAGATRIGHSVNIPYLKPKTADSILDRLYAEACLSDFRW